MLNMHGLSNTVDRMGKNGVKEEGRGEIIVKMEERVKQWREKQNRKNKLGKSYFLFYYFTSFPLLPILFFPLLSSDFLSSLFLCLDLLSSCLTVFHFFFHLFLSFAPFFSFPVPHFFSYTCLNFPLLCCPFIPFPPLLSALPFHSSCPFS